MRKGGIRPAITRYSSNNPQGCKEVVRREEVEINTGTPVAKFLARAMNVALVGHEERTGYSFIRYKVMTCSSQGQ